MAENSYLEDPTLIDALKRAPLCDLLSQCRALEGRILARLFADQQHATSADGDKLLSVEDAAELLSVTKQFLYRNGRNLNLAVELGPGTLRYSQAAILKYIVKSAAKTHARKP